MKTPPSSTVIRNFWSRSADRKDLLLCFSHLRWDFVYQRPQHLLSRAARRYHVIFFEEPLFEAPGVPARLDLSSRPDGVTVAVPRLPGGLRPEAVIRAQRILLDRFMARQARRPAILWYYSPSAFAFSRHLDAGVRLYDCMDELSAFRGAPAGLRDQERGLMAACDLVFTGGVSLWQAKRDLHRAVHAFPSSIDVSHFAKARGGLADPLDQAAIARPRIGFFGVIDERMDLDLVRALARRRPDWRFVMIGPVAKIDERDLPRAPNIHWLGAKSYAELPAYLAGWDAGFMPFALNEATRFISPTKTPEFLAAGLPVVSTAIADVIRPYGEKGLVGIASDADGLVQALERALAGSTPAWREKVERQLATTSWDRVWAEMSRLILDTRERRRAKPSRPAVAAGLEGVARV